MAFGGFVKGNLGPSLVGGVGAMIGVWGFLGDAQSLWTAGIKPDYLQLSGFVMFVAATVAVLYRQHEVIEARLGDPPSARSGSAPSKVGRASTAVTTQPPSTAERVFVPNGTALEDMTGLYKGHTDLQGEKLTHVYLGKWVRVDGTLRNLYGSLGGTYAVHLSRSGREGSAPDGVPRLEFNPEWADRLATIPVGGKISVVGKIRKIESHCVWIDDCELVEPIP